MANEKTLEILKKMKADPKAKELFEGMEKPASPEEMISAYVQIAEKLGYGITADDIRETIKQEETIRKANTDKVVADMQELKDDDVENVAGGAYPDIFLKCGEAMQAVFDICWKNDVCSISVN